MLIQSNLVHQARWCKKSFKLKVPYPYLNGQQTWRTPSDESTELSPCSYKKCVVEWHIVKHWKGAPQWTSLFFRYECQIQLSQLSRKWALLLGMPTLIHFVLKYIQIVCSSYSNDIFLGVPGGMKYFLVEVQAVNTYFIFLSLATCTHFAWLQNCARFIVFP